MFTTYPRVFLLILWLAFAGALVVMMDVPTWGGVLLAALGVGVPLLIARRFSSPPDESMSEQIQRALR